MPPFTLPYQCCRLFFEKSILGKKIQAQSNIERGNSKGRVKIGNKSTNMSLKYILDSVVSTILSAIV